MKAPAYRLRIRDRARHPIRYRCRTPATRDDAHTATGQGNPPYRKSVALVHPDRRYPPYTGDSGRACSPKGVRDIDGEVLCGAANRRGTDRNIQDHLDAGVIHQVHHPVEPRKIKMPLGRLIAVPGQMPHPHHVETRGLFISRISRLSIFAIFLSSCG